MAVDDEVPVSLIIEDGQSDDFGIEELCRHPKRVLWLSVRDGRRVVYKGLTEDLRHHPEEIASLRKEYSLGLRIDHEGVVRFYGFEMHQQLGPIIVMEYVDGYKLNDYLRDGQSDDANLPALDERLKISKDIAESLAMIHDAGILHRDLKPDNILIRKRDLRPKIIDFGHADADDFIIYKKSVGTPQYGSPEQQVPSRGSMAGDVYSLGIILEKLLPERRYRTIIDACISADESKRPSIKWIGEHLSTPGRRSLRWIWIIGAVVVLSLAACLAAYLWDGEPGAVIDGAYGVTTADGIIEPRAIERAPVDVEKKEVVMPALGAASVTKEDNAMAPLSSEKPKIVDAATSRNIQDDMNAVVDKYAREADKVNERYGKLSYINDVEENSRLRIKRSEEHYALSDRMDKELSDLGIDKSRRHDAYLQLWAYIVFETNRIDDVDGLREKIMQK